MRIQEFLEHHGIGGNPFAEEDAQNDTVFKRTCLESTFHPAWDKVYGDPDDPSTAIVFGEKGSGKTALKLQMVRQFERHAADHPDRKTFVVLYDDFNPFLDRFIDRVGPRRPVEKVLAHWKLWDHIDAILTLATTQLVSQLLDGGRGKPRLGPAQARDLALLAACYDQSTGETFPSRWARLRRLVGYRTWRATWPWWLGVVVLTVFLGALAGALTRGAGWGGIVPSGAPWWVPVAVVLIAWGPWVWQRARAWWTARKVVGSMRTGNRTVGQLTQALARMPTVDLAGQPLPRHARSDDRYELLAKFQGILTSLGYGGMVVIVDRVDEPHAINGQADRMRQLVWPLLDNKFLKSPGLGFKLLLPDELYRFIEREDEQFNQRARLDKQNLVPNLEWTGETLYDIASQRVKAASTGSPPATLAQLFDPAVDQRRLIDGLRTLRVPRHLFKFLHRLCVAHCHSHTSEQPVWTIPLERFEKELAVFRRDQEAFDRGLAPALMDADLHTLAVGRDAMACRFEAVFNAGEPDDATQRGIDALEVVEALEARLTIHRPGGELSRLNAAAAGGWQPVADDLFVLFERADELWRLTDGAFDMATGALSRCWGFLRRSGRTPAAEELAAALAVSGWGRVELDRVGRRIRFTTPGVELNPGAIGKGYALDRAATALAGVPSFLLHGGSSSVVARGVQGPALPGRRGWRVGVRHPLRPQTRLATLTLVDRALGTSGSGTQFFIDRGRRLGHILDPRSGSPAEGVLSATVLAPSAADADALATAAYVLGPAGLDRIAPPGGTVAALVAVPARTAGGVRVVTANLPDESVAWSTEPGLEIIRAC